MLKYLKSVIKGTCIAGLVLAGAFIQPQAHNSYLRWEVGESVVQVLSPAGGGGTGFAVKATSGKEFIATNKHVCEAAVNGWLLIKFGENEPAPRRVIYKDNRHDICLVEGGFDLAPLDLASEPETGDFHYIVGHPSLRPLTVSQGEFIGMETVRLIDEEVTDPKQCKGEIFNLNILERLMYGRDFVCVRSYKSYASSAVAYPGNSGSPVVNKYGNVIGILFAGNSEREHQVSLVPVYELERVLAKF